MISFSSCVEGARDLGALLRVGVLAVGRPRTARAPPPRPPWRPPGGRASRGSGSPRRASRRARSGSARPAPGRSSAPRPRASPCPPWRAAPRSRAQIFLISSWAMSSASRTSASVTPLAPHSTIRIASLGPGDDEVHLELLRGLLGGVDHEVAVELADPHRRRRGSAPGSARRRPPPRRRSWPGCRRGGRSRPTSAGRRSGSRSASPWGTAGGAAGRSSAPSASPSRRPCASRRKKEPGIFPAA